MSTEFQKAMDYKFLVSKTHCLLDDIKLASARSESDHINYVIKCLNKLIEDNLRIILQKCHFAKSEIEWLGYKITQTGLSPLESILDEYQ